LYQKFEYSVAKAEYHKYDGEPKFNIELADKIGAKYILVYMNKLIKFVENPNKFKDVDIDGLNVKKGQELKVTKKDKKVTLSGDGKSKDITFSTKNDTKDKF